MSKLTLYIDPTDGTYTVNPPTTTTLQSRLEWHEDRLQTEETVYQRPHLLTHLRAEVASLRRAIAAHPDD
jgi:hypothetical protein